MIEALGIAAAIVEVLVVATVCLCIARLVWAATRPRTTEARTFYAENHEEDDDTFMPTWPEPGITRGGSSDEELDGG